MKRRNNRFLAGTLAGLMMLTMLPVTALAAEDGAAGEPTTAVDGAAVPGTSDSRIVNVVNDDKDSQNSGNSGAPTQSVEKNNENTDNNSTDKKAESNDSTDKQDDSSSNTGENSDSNAPVNNNGEGGENSTPDSAPAKTFTAKIGGTEYETLDAAINAAQDGDTIEIGQDITIEEGGLAFVEKGALTIKGAGESKPTITLNSLGMWLNKTNVTFENIKIVEESVTNNPADSGGTANLVSNSNFTFKNASLELNGPGNKTGGSGMYLY